MLLLLLLVRLSWWLFLPTQLGEIEGWIHLSTPPADPADLKLLLMVGVVLTEKFSMSAKDNLTPFGAVRIFVVLTVGYYPDLSCYAYCYYYPSSLMWLLSLIFSLPAGILLFYVLALVGVVLA